MEKSKAKLFISHHPSNLILFKNMAEIVRKYDKESKIILFKVNHVYFDKFDDEPYKKFFDEIVEFDFINYEKNFLIGYWKIFSFKKQLNKMTNGLLKNFRTIDLFLTDSAWLPVNVLLCNLSKQKNIKNITKIFMVEPESSQTKTDKIKTFLANLYPLPFKSYKIKVISTLGGKFMDFVYNDNIPGNMVKIISPVKKESIGKNVLPYLVNSTNFSKSQKDMVVIFGDASIFKFYAEYLPEYKIFVKKLTAFFKALEDKYSDYKLYYKPHPAEKGEIMPGVNIKKYSLLDNSINAETILDIYNQKIKAVYSFSSTSVATASFFGIPSYTFYKYLSNNAGVKRFNSMFEKNNIKSKFLFNLFDLEEIGRIDNLKSRNINIEKLEEKYRKVLNI